MTPDSALPANGTIREHIEITPGVCGGKPRIAGHRITVHDIVIWHERAGMSPDDIVAAYPQLSMADVHAALTYYWDHRDDIREKIKSDDEFAEALMASTPSLIEERMREVRASDNSVSP